MIERNSSSSPVSHAFADALASGLVGFDAALYLGGARVPGEVMSMTVELGASPDAEDAADGLPLGCACSARVTAALAGCTAALLGLDVEVRVGVDVGGSYEHVTVATATVTYSRTQAGVTTVQALGPISAKMAMAEVGLAEGQHAAADVAAAIARASGVAVGFGPFRTVEQQVHVPSPCSCRSALSALALRMGGFAAENGDGSVTVAPFAAAAAMALDPDLVPVLPSLSDADYEIDGLTVTVPADEIATWGGDGEDEGDDGEEEPQGAVYVFGTGRIAVEDPNATEDTARAMWENLRGASFAPGEVSVTVLDPRLTPFDAVSVELDGVSRLVPAMGISASYDGGYFGSFSASGQSEAAEGALPEGPLSAEVQRASSTALEAARHAASAERDASRARNAAESAEADAADAKRAATEAKDDAATAKDAAGAAVDDAATAQRAAGEAKADAADAKASASRANLYSTAALDQLGVVQDVAGILKWASEHGTFERTTDESPQEGTAYFTWDSASGDYAPVVDPQADQMGSYYVLTVGEAMNDFIMAHLAVTSRGLWVLPNGQGGAADAQHAAGYKMLLASDGAYLYDADGALVRSDTADGTDFSADRAFHIGNDDAYILFSPASGGEPASIVIGGSHVQLGSSKTLSEWEAEVARAVDDAAAARDSAHISITSTRGNLFKNGSESTVLQVAVFPAGGGRLDTIGDVRARFGAGAYVQWRWMHEGTGEWGVLASDDPHLSMGGMWLAVAPDDVATKTTFEASLVTP